MNRIKFFSVGIFLGIVLTKSEAVSWYRIFEMFTFRSFHMYGIIGTAVGLGIFGVWAIKKWELRSSSGKVIALADKKRSVARYLFGGILFGLGWALAGACPGPMYILLGTGALSIVVVIAGALLGTFCYGLLRDKLPH